jgi:hypothetical protein
LQSPGCPSLRSSFLLTSLRVLRKLRRLSWFLAAVSRCTPLLCICGLSRWLTHKTFASGKATYTAAPPCNRHLPAASGTGTEAMRLRCWHKPHAIASKPRIASHVEVAASLFVPHSFRSSPRCPHGGWWRTVSLPSLRSSFLLTTFIQASLPMAAVHNSALDYSHYRSEHR